jgi:hypothetical protein
LAAQVSLVEALPSAMASAGSALLWLVCVALVVWSLVRLRRSLSIVLAIALVAPTAFLVWAHSTLAWLSSLAVVLVGFVCFRRPGALLSVVCVAVWATVTWTHWGWVVVYEETGACLFPATLEDPLPDPVPCELPHWT